MKVRTHFHLAKLALKNIKTKYPKDFSLNMFYIGTIIADCSWLPYTNPHFHKKSFKYVEDKLEKLINKRKFNAYNSLQFGIIIHYLCDFCCYSHISGGIGDVGDHIIYERKIQKYLLHNISKISKMIVSKSYNNTQELKKFINSQIAKYKEGKHSFMWDIENSIEISSIVCSAVFDKYNLKGKVIGQV